MGPLFPCLNPGLSSRFLEGVLFRLELCRFSLIVLHCFSTFYNETSMIVLPETEEKFPLFYILITLPYT